MPTQRRTNTPETNPASRTRARSGRRSSTTDTGRQRQRRVAEYEKQGLDKPEAFEACMAAIQADQIGIGFALGAAIKQKLTESQARPEMLLELEKPLDIYLRVTRQIERCRQLEIRQAEVQRATDTARSQLLARRDRQPDGASDRPRSVPK
jgi:hypothetical protein